MLVSTKKCTIYSNKTYYVWFIQIERSKLLSAFTHFCLTLCNIGVKNFYSKYIVWLVILFQFDSLTKNWTRFRSVLIKRRYERTELQMKYEEQMEVIAVHSFIIASSARLFRSLRRKQNLTSSRSWWNVQDTTYTQYYLVSLI